MRLCIRCSYIGITVYLPIEKSRVFLSLPFRFFRQRHSPHTVQYYHIFYYNIILSWSSYHNMSSFSSWLRVVLAFALLAVVYGAPIWEELFGFPPRQHYHQRNSQPTARTPRAGGKEKYKATCWVINPDNYAFPGQSPYPSAPLCPY